MADREHRIVFRAGRWQVQVRQWLVEHEGSADNEERAWGVLWSGSSRFAADEYLRGVTSRHDRLLSTYERTM